MENGITNETLFAKNFRRELQTLNYVELNYLISDIMLEIKKRSFNEGMVKGMTSFGSAPVEPEKSPQQIRDEIVEKAKRDVTGLKNDTGNYGVHSGIGIRHCTAEFIVNNEKRTIVVLLRGIISNKIRAKGIAKCDPSDCFNVHIGKAIALRRALGLEVPADYLSAPQPTEVRVGDVVKYEDDDRIATVIAENSNVSVSEETYISTAQLWKALIIDDSREGVTE